MAIERWRPKWGLVPWSPLRELSDIERNMDTMFGESSLPSLWSRSPEAKGWFPAMDVFEKDGKFVVKAEIPGIDEGNINVSVEGDTLMIKGEKKMEKEVKEEDYYRSERSYGSFVRSIPLSSAVDKDKIEANYENGVLEVTLPKIAEKKPKKVKVTASKKTAK